LWTRLNPDRAYVDCFIRGRESWPEHPAGAAPADWTDAAEWGYPDSPQAVRWFPVAAIAEMADRAYAGEWSPDLNNVLAGACGG
jgi:hypothetical protein